MNLFEMCIAANSTKLSDYSKINETKKNKCEKSKISLQFPWQSLFVLCVVACAFARIKFFVDYSLWKQAYEMAAKIRPNSAISIWNHFFLHTLQSKITISSCELWTTAVIVECVCEKWVFYLLLSQMNNHKNDQTRETWKKLFVKTNGKYRI